MRNAVAIVTYLEALKATPSTNDKVELLKEYLKNPYFTEFVQLALTSYYSYNISHIPKKRSTPLFHEATTLREVFDELIKFSKKSGITNEEKGAFTYLVADPMMNRIASLIVKKRLDCGVSAKLINKAVPGTIFVMPYMRCRDIKNIDRIHYPALLDVKADGMFLNIMSKFSGIEFKTRTGHLFHLKNPQIIEQLEGMFVNDEVVMMGEARIYSDGAYLSRKTSNGLLNSILSGTAPQMAHNKVVLTIWDIVPLDDFNAGYCETPYTDRKDELMNVGLTENTFPINLIHSELVHSKEQAFEKTAKFIEQGEEGGVLKNCNGEWKNTSSGSPDCIKLKSEKECDLRITGWNYAEPGSKFDGLMGSVTCITEDGGLIVDVSGWNDIERSWDWDDHIGKIVTVKFNEVITRKTDDIYSLFLPRVAKLDRASFVEFRFDKTEANSTDEVLEMK